MNKKNRLNSNVYHKKFQTEKRAPYKIITFIIILQMNKKVIKTL